MGIFDATGLRVPGRRNYVGTHRDNRRRSIDRNSRNDLADVHRMPDDNRIAVDFERERVGYDAGAESGGNSRSEIAALR